jgi:hypothetical protein
MLKIEAFFPCNIRKVYAVQKFCMGTVSDHCGEFFELNTEISPTHVLISLDCIAWLPEVLPRIQVRSFFSFTLPYSSSNL